VSGWLDLEEVTGGYGSSQVLFGVSFSVDPGEVVTLMGRNGMGKPNRAQHHGIKPNLRR
jgi:branched-chain amino acid transport system ATP-binding protein